MRRSRKPIYVYRVGQLGDSLVALPSLHWLKRLAADSPMVLISDQVRGREMVSSWEVFRLARIFSASVFYTPVNCSRLRSAAELTSIAIKTRIMGRGPVYYLVDTGVSSRRLRMHKLFFERLCGLEMLGTNEASKPYITRDDKGRVLPQPPEHKRLLGIAGNGSTVCNSSHYPELLPRSQRLADKVDSYWATIPQHLIPVAFGPGSKMPCKRWPFERFAEAGHKMICEYGVIPIIFGGMEDRTLAERLVNSWNRVGINLCGIEIAEAAEAMRRCAFFVGNDTGTMHLAATVGLKCAAIFSARDAPGRWNPVGDGHVILRESVPCEGCMYFVCPQEVPDCIGRITVDRVVRAAECFLTGSQASAM